MPHEEDWTAHPKWAYSAWYREVRRSARGFGLEERAGSCTRREGARLWKQKKCWAAEVGRKRARAV